VGVEIGTTLLKDCDLAVTHWPSTVSTISTVSTQITRQKIECNHGVVEYTRGGLTHRPQAREMSKGVARARTSISTLALHNSHFFLVHNAHLFFYFFHVLLLHNSHNVHCSGVLRELSPARAILFRVRSPRYTCAGLPFSLS
jgi:hypothetical protein